MNRKRKEEKVKNSERKLPKRWIKCISIISIFVILVSVFFIYCGVTYHADEGSIESFYSDSVSYSVENDGKNYVVSPNGQCDTLIVFYPGAKVDCDAYLPLMGKLAKKGYLCVIVDMPLNMAFFGTNKADDVIKKYKKENVYMMGHSLGGVIASKYTEKHESVDGLILLGAYIYGDYSDENTLTIYGEYNSDVAKKIDYEKNIKIIKGGNHANFGNYGKQRGDKNADITNDEQQNIAVKYIDEFIRNRVV